MKKALTLIELVLVIVIIGIISTIVIPKEEKDTKNNASTQIISHIRYTQELALQDNKHKKDYDEKWQNGYWKFTWTNCSGDNGAFYTISSDKDLNYGIAKEESIIDPSTGKYLYLNSTYCIDKTSESDESTDIDLYKRFGITKIIKTGGCKVQNVSFDFLGRPHSGKYTASNFEHIMHEDCNLTFEYDTDQRFIITITAQTGYTFLNK